jgi:TonB family protein
MKQTSSKIIIALLMLCITGVSVSAQHRHRRAPRPIPQVKEVKQANVRSATPEEDALVEEGCSLSDTPKPETAIKMAVLCGRALSLPKPTYPKEAKAQKVSGPVKVSVVMDESGRVIWAKALSGHPLLQNVAVKAACRARYSPMLISGRAVKAETLITYNFMPQ